MNECLTDMVGKVRRQRAGARSNDLSSPDQRGSTLISQSANASLHVETLESVSEREMLQREARDSEQRRATAQDTLDNVLLCNDESNARYQEELRQMRARFEELNMQNQQLMQRLQFVEQERETNTARQEAPTREFALTPTANCQDEEVLAPVSDVFELLIIEPGESEKQGHFMISVPSSAVGARLRATINQ